MFGTCQFRIFGDDHRFGETKIDDAKLIAAAVTAFDNIAGFDIAVNDSNGMHLSEQWEHDVRRQIHGIVHRDPTSEAGPRKPGAVIGKNFPGIVPASFVAIGIV